MENLKTLGKTGAELISRLYSDNREIFTMKDVNNIFHKRPGTNEALMSMLVRKNIVTRLKKGKYIIVPQQFGIVPNYTGNVFAAAREIANSPDYYIAFYSAMDFWGMLTQPLLTVFVATPKRQQPPKGMEKSFRFIYVKPESIWGINNEQAAQNETARVSDRERTIIDALAHPEYSGGITEAAKGIWISREKLDFNKLALYTSRYGRNSVAKRLGYLLEILGIRKPDIIPELRQYVKGRYDIFDPALPRKNLAKNNWRLIDNVTPEQITRLIWS